MSQLLQPTLQPDLSLETYMRTSYLYRVFRPSVMQAKLLQPKTI